MRTTVRGGFLMVAFALSVSSWRHRLGVLSLLCMASLPVQALSPEIEAERLLLAADSYMEGGDHSRAAQALERMEKLQVKLPAEYYFLKGSLAWHFRDNDGARAALEEYIQQTGREGEHYKETLTLLTRIEETGAGSTSSEKSGEANIQWQNPARSVHSDEYVEQLRKLYLKDSPQEALVVHINSLLASAPFRPSRIVTPDQREGVRYSMSLGDRGVLLVQETSFDDSGKAVVNLDRREVFGIDPYVRYSCDRQRRACWIYDPQDQLQEWILFGEDTAVADDLTKAVTKLLLMMQSSA